MKKIVLFLFVILVFQQQAICQYTKGKFYIEANYNYFDNGKMVDDVGTQEITSTFSSNVGYFVANNLVLGIGLNYNYWYNSSTALGMTVSLNGVYMNKNYDTGSDMINGFSPSVFVKYIYPVTNKLGVSIMAKGFMGKLTELTYQSERDVIQKTSQTYYSTRADGNYKGVLLSPEVRYLIIKRLGLQLNFNGLNIVSMSMSEPSILNTSGSTQYQYQTSFPGPPTINKATGISFAPKDWSMGVFLLL